MMTNPRDALKGQSRSPNMVPFDRVCMISYYRPIVSLSVRDRSFWDIQLQKCRDLENRVRGTLWLL